ncbi:hypothetical protein HAU32_02010 [Weissella confusa]|uniref:Polysaccharide pyruvyl transferase family protein n=1 Tax=Weissella fermenti TaxID=2987699 RepID=A0ABT6D163_9LACO|nr:MULTISPECIES: polysaccharide pyruvyl transferase family protein [Weissella]MBJ7687768.1 hypothetical protein [Weissella confusa]MCW0926680.1 polysaccharide pyruvyl transferase family protein [Weissella sp. LMG 11983]MDF9299111.1 polysaccharide pyruvyl transferase family protein [Weissella sp. BK2]
MRNNFGQWLRRRVLWRWTMRPQLKKQLEQLNTDLPTVFYLGMPEHGDLGDHAVAYATEIFLQKNLPEHQIVKVPSEALSDALPLIQRIIQPEHLVLMHGGGIVGDRHLPEENLRREIVSYLKDQPIIQLPQSMFFTNPAEQEASKRTYNVAERMVMLAREEKALQDLTQLLLCPAMLIPDMVLYLSGRLAASRKPRHGAMIMMHATGNDYRRTVQNDIRELLNELFSHVVEADFLNAKQRHLSGQKRDVALRECWRKISGYEVLVTDEIHGLLFGLITKTPTVAVAEPSGMLAAIFEAWCTAVPWISLWSPADGPLDVAVVDVMKVEASAVDYSRQFAPLEYYLANFRAETD